MSSGTAEDAERLTFTVEEVAKRLGLSRGLTYEAVRTGQIPSVRIGRRILIPRAALERKLQSPRTETPPSARQTQAR
jgi:excisionase family DNA binding protein